jgi:phosphatidylserine/phosphatidylglycerophosphate/cardiolipin synthase-like enzyme
MAQPGDLDQQLRRAVEGLSEDERLRSELTDDEARVLLAWGERELNGAADATRPAARNNAPAAAERFDADSRRIRVVLRDINDLTGARAGLSESELTNRVAGILASWQGVAPGQVTLGKGDLALLSGAPDNATFIQRLTELLSSRRGNTGGAAGGRGAGSSGGPGLSPLIIGLAALLVVCAVAAIGFMIFRGRQGAGPTPTPTQPAAFVPPTQAAGPAPVTPGAPGTPGLQRGPTWYQVYFTTPKYPDKAADHKPSLDARLTDFINRAQKSVDMAIYQLDLPNVTQALLDAKKRGATVRVVTDIDILNDSKESPSFKQLQDAGITVVGGNPSGIMHDKFVVVDGQAVWTGSWNFTTNDTYRYNNNGIEIQSPELARNYTTTFEKMWRDKKFAGSRKPGGTTPKLVINGTPVENYFAPEDKVTDKVVARLLTAQKSIDFLAYSFTDDAMGGAIEARAKAGARVRGVFETTGSETKYSEYGKLKEAGLDVWQDGNPYLMHHKVFIIDGKTVIFGSFNFSDSANTQNDENLLIIDDPALAAQFTQEFERAYAQAKNPPAKKQPASPEGGT